MNITSISPNAHQLTRLGLMNCYLVAESDGFTLIDTMISGSAKDILAAANSLNRGLIRRILLTHAHSDTHRLPRRSRHHHWRCRRLPTRRRNLPARGSTARQAAKFRYASWRAALQTQGRIPRSQNSCLPPRRRRRALRLPPLHRHPRPHPRPLQFPRRGATAPSTLATPSSPSAAPPHVPGFGPWYFPLPKFATWDRPLSVASVRNLLDIPSPA